MDQVKKVCKAKAQGARGTLDRLRCAAVHCPRPEILEFLLAFCGVPQFEKNARNFAAQRRMPPIQAYFENIHDSFWSERGHETAETAKNKPVLHSFAHQSSPIWQRLNEFSTNANFSRFDLVGELRRMAKIQDFLPNFEQILRHFAGSGVAFSHQILRGCRSNLSGLGQIGGSDRIHCSS